MLASVHRISSLAADGPARARWAQMPGGPANLYDFCAMVQVNCTRPCGLRQSVAWTPPDVASVSRRLTSSLHSSRQQASASDVVTKDPVQSLSARARHAGRMDVYVSGASPPLIDRLA